jgi:hypothetical protein
MTTAIRLATAFSIIVFAAAPASAQTYEWVDEQGARHFTDNINRVPERYRPGATQLDSVAPTRETIVKDAARRARDDADAARRNANDALRQRASDLADLEEAWNRAAGLCAQTSLVQLNLQPGARATILGTTQQRFNFAKCMTDAGLSPENYTTIKVR